MYVLRTQNWDRNGHGTGVADGMFVRSSGLFTSNKESAKLFDSELEAEAFVKQWEEVRGSDVPLFLVAVETKNVPQRVLGTIKQLTKVAGNKLSTGS